MTAIRLVSKTDDAEFPYSEAKHLLFIVNTDAQFEPVDFDAMIAAGCRVGWSDALIQSHRALAKRGNCFSFRIHHPPYLQGILYEDNLFFSFTDSEHQLRCEPEIVKLSQLLGLELFWC